MSSRLARDSRGRLIVELTVTTEAGTAGERLLGLGNTFRDGRIGWLGEQTGRVPERQGRAQPPGRVGTRRETWPADYPGKARELQAGGLGCMRIAAQLDVPLGTVKFWLRKPAPPELVPELVPD